jgi:hypothetical protein
MFENNIPPDKKESKNEYNEEFYKNTIQLFDVLYNDVEYLKK